MTLATSRALVMLVLPVAVLVVTAVVSKVLSARPASHRRSTDRPQPRFAHLPASGRGRDAVLHCTALQHELQQDNRCARRRAARASSRPPVLWRCRSCTCTRTAAHMSARANTHTCTHTDTHRANIHRHTHTHARAQLCTRANAHVHTHPRTPMRAPTHVLARAGTRAS